MRIVYFGVILFFFYPQQITTEVTLKRTYLLLITCFQFKNPFNPSPLFGENIYKDSAAILSSQARNSGSKAFTSVWWVHIQRFGKREVWVRLASVVPKRKNGLMTHCNVWVHSYPNVAMRYYSFVTFGYDWHLSYPNVTMSH